MNGKEVSNWMLSNSRSVTFLAGGIILRDPIENAFEISDSLIVEDKFHGHSRTEAFDACPCLVEGEQLTIWVSDPAAHLGNLLIRQLDRVHVLDIVQQRPGCGVLLAFRKLLDPANGLF